MQNVSPKRRSARLRVQKSSATEVGTKENHFMWKVKSTLQRAGRMRCARPGTEKGGAKRGYLFGAVLSVLLFAGVAGAQYDQHPLLDKAANKVIRKYQNSSCEQLWQERQQPKSQREQEAVNFLRSDPQMRAMFIQRVAAPVANKLFECGMIP
jgi:hypothetical protein